MCYKAQFYGIESHRCVQMTPTLRCNQQCLFCWRSFEHEVVEEEECPPAEIIGNLRRLQKRALSGYKVSPYVTPERFAEALRPTMVAISLSGEPTCYSHLPELIDGLNAEGYTTFLVSNGTHPTSRPVPALPGLRLSGRSRPGDLPPPLPAKGGLLGSGAGEPRRTCRPPVGHPHHGGAWLQRLLRPSGMRRSTRTPEPASWK